jgi:hypothetical protein
MFRILALCLCMLLSPPAMALAGELSGDDQVPVPQSATGEEQTAASREASGDKESEAKEMSGMSIVGNDEAPKSLYIVPWKSSEIGVQTSLDTMLSEDDVPVDREVFKRQIEFYQFSTNK